MERLPIPMRRARHQAETWNKSPAVYSRNERSWVQTPQLKCEKVKNCISVFGHFVVAVIISDLLLNHACNLYLGRAFEYSSWEFVPMKRNRNGSGAQWFFHFWKLSGHEQGRFGCGWLVEFGHLHLRFKSMTFVSLV